MPPPPAPVEKSEKRPVAAKVEDDSAKPKAEDASMAIVPASGAVVEADENAQQEEKGEEGAEPETEGNELATQLPIGFFDDADTDAKVRGLEAPSIKQARELEEGLKKFEREINIEQEKAEETRHELDEAKYEKVAAEEAEYQGELQGRLLQLRERQRLRAEAAASASVTASAGAQGQNAAEQEEDEEGDSGSDVEFDWRAKGFG